MRWPGRAPKTAPPVPERPLPTGLAVLGVVICCLVAGLSCVIEVLLIPFYVGSNVFPITVVIAVLVNLALPTMVRIIADRGWPVALPAICWVVVAVALGFTNTGRGNVIVPGYGQGQYVGLALFFAGTLAAFIGVVREVVRADVSADQLRAGSAPSVRR